ncbi:preprotein translocase subunit SecG [candidate division WWE3 bacterium RBG_19FT_COMBO_34_6]|uniref:Protein-export membrane protein SecG n=1 Tax=candidate division WWE3 bacterium RBG_19FT_COMBO_34_6 TaxID=1802612 RepID=A0A1F4UL86_UNCKA|nr:MAG: preprotein translocase subunit SecG [candidate division WWE3 bacterium RBG_19FT_COMBO_34_6]
MHILRILQVIFSVMVTILVLIQTKGGGFTSGVGSSISFYRSRRGLEKSVFIFTIILSIVLVVNSLLLVIFS